MTQTPKQQHPTTRRLLVVAAIALVASFGVAVLVVIVSTGLGEKTALVGEPNLYREIGARLTTGDLPYIDVEIEHLPVMVVPIFAAGLIAQVTPLPFWMVWIAMTSAAVLGTIALAARARVTASYASTVLLVALPTLPLVLFRLESFVVLLAMMSIAAFAASRFIAGSVYAIVGALAKGWPIALLAVPFRKGRRTLAVSALASTAVMLATVGMLPGFRSGRAFEGIHGETIVGNAIVMVRLLAGGDPHLVGAAGATYASASALAIPANALVGLPFVLLAGVALVRRRSLQGLLHAIGLGVAGLILGSPLFSAQFVYWLVPFVPLAATRTRRLYMVAGALTTFFVAFWATGEVWWTAIVTLRNGVFLAAAIAWALEMRGRPVPAEASDAGQDLSEELSGIAVGHGSDLLGRADGDD